MKTFKEFKAEQLGEAVRDRTTGETHKSWKDAFWSAAAQAQIDTPDELNKFAKIWSVKAGGGGAQYSDAKVWAVQIAKQWKKDGVKGFNEECELEEKKIQEGASAKVKATKSHVQSAMTEISKLATPDAQKVFGKLLDAERLLMKLEKGAK